MAKLRRWLITGAGSGIGAALAQAALHRGDIVFGGVRNPAGLDRFAALAPGRAIPLQLDVRDQAQIGSAVHAAITDGPLDVVVSNAGCNLFGAFEETSIQEARALFDVNVFGAWALAQAALPHLRAQGTGWLVHVSSGCGLIGMPGMSAYSASKFALEGFTEALAQEVAPFGIKVMLVEPGAVATRFISHGTQNVARRMPEYGFLSGQGKSMLDAYYASAAATADSVAAAMLAALDNPTPPLRLLLGADTSGPVRAKGEQLITLAGG